MMYLRLCRGISVSSPIVIVVVKCPKIFSSAVTGAALSVACRRCKSSTVPSAGVVESQKDARRLADQSLIMGFTHPGEFGIHAHARGPQTNIQA